MLMTNRDTSPSRQHLDWRTVRPGAPAPGAPRKSRAACAQLKSSARARASCRGTASAPDRPLQIGVHDTALLSGRPRAPQHLQRSVHRVGRHRRAAGHGLQHDQAEGLGPARKHEHDRPPHTPWPVRRAAARPASAPAGNVALQRGLAAARRRTPPWCPGMSSSQEGLDVFLVGHPAHKQRHRPRQRPSGGYSAGCGWKANRPRVHAMRPAAQVAKAALLQHAQHALRWAPSRRTRACGNGGTARNPRTAALCKAALRISGNLVWKAVVKASPACRQ